MSYRNALNATEAAVKSILKSEKAKKKEAMELDRTEELEAMRSHFLKRRSSLTLFHLPSMARIMERS